MRLPRPALARAARDRHRPSQGETLNRAFQALNRRHERRVAAESRVGRRLQNVNTEVAVERHRREARETEELIARMEARGRGEVVRTPAGVSRYDLYPGEIGR